MKKQIKILLSLMLALLISINIMPTVVYANSAEPTYNSLGTGIVFEPTEEIAVKSEVLDIVMSEETAKITATYKMVNLTDKVIDIESMFVTPQFDKESENFTVKIDGTVVDYESKMFSMKWDTEIDKQDWEYIIVNGDDKYRDWYGGVQTVKYNMHFDANAEIEVMVSYDYRLGGYPTSQNYTGTFLYYLTPAKYWSDFTDLTINLTLSESHPKIDRSSVKFEKIDKLIYQYKADELPSEELEIRVGKSWYVDAWNTLTNPMLWMIFGIPLLIFVVLPALIIIAVVIIRKKIKKKKENK